MGQIHSKTLKLPLPAFGLLLLIPLIILLVGGGGLFIHYSREIVADNSHVYGQYRASLDLAERGEDLSTQLWFLIATPVWRKNTQALEECRRNLEALALASKQAAPYTRMLLEKLEALRVLRQQLRDLEESYLKASVQQQNLDQFLAKRLALDNEAHDLLRSLPELTKQLSEASSAVKDMGKQLKLNVISAQDQENSMLLFWVVMAVYLALVVWVVLKQVIHPLLGLRSYVASMGTGVALKQPPASRITAIFDLTDSLENLAVYLGQATIRSEKIETERTQFRRMSLYDGLTNLYNRRAFDDKLQNLATKAKQTGKPLGLIMMDVDKFKVYNDSLGHQAGDVCLRKVAGAVAKFVREGDVPARYGGEEFVVILPDTNPEQALKAAERLRAAVEAIKLPHPGSPAGPYVTISLGVTSEILSQESQPSDLVLKADAALYYSKENGRNRATLYDLNLTPPKV